MLKKFATKHKDNFYVIFRVLVGLLFAQHGAQKLFGALGGTAVPLVSQFGLSGVIEFFGGLAVALGLFARLGALLGALEMLVAYVMAHASKGFFPIQNGGELAVMYFVAFLVVLGVGTKKASLEKKLFKKELF